MATLIVNQNGERISEKQAPIQAYTVDQMKQVQEGWSRFEANQRRMGALQGVASDVNQKQSLHGNAFPIHKDQWGEWAKDGIELQRSQLGVFNDLASSVSRTYPIGELVDYFQTISDSSEDVSFSLDGRSRGKTDQAVLEYHGTPLGFYSNSCSFGWLQMEAMQRHGGSGNLQQANMRNKQRHMAERLENMVLFGEAGLDVGGNKSYGLLNHPNRNTSITGLNIIGASPAAIKDAVVGVLQAGHADNFKNGYTLYMNWDDYFYIQTYQNAMATANGTPTATGAQRQTIENELLNIPGLERIVATDSIPTDTLVALVKDRSVVEVLSGMPMSMSPQFRANPQDDYVFLNMAAQALQLKFDYDGSMGLVVGTPT